MQLNASNLVHEQKLTESFMLPTRHLELRIELPSGYPWVGRAKDAPPESVTAVVEVSTNGAPYVEKARVGPLNEPGVWTLPLPPAGENEDAPDFVMSGQRKSSARVRLLHDGRHEPRVRLSVIGL